MIFPVNPGADASNYIALAQQCINSNVCFDVIRPVGIIYYYALLVKLFPDPVKLSYIILMLNMFYICGIYLIVNQIFNKENKIMVKFYLFFVVAINLICLLPVSMSDLVSLFVLFIGIYLLFEKVDLVISTRKNNIYIFFCGLLFAISFLLKQISGISGFIFAVILVCFKLKKLFENKKDFFKKIIIFLIGFSFVLIQFIIIYNNYHQFWFYDKVAMSSAIQFQSQPFIEAYGYTEIINPVNDVVPGFYFMILDNHVNQVFFILYKFFRGLSNIDLIIYHGFRPTINNLIHITLIDYFKVATLSICLMLIGYLLFVLKELKIFISIFIFAIFIGLVIAYSGHVENRYFILSRIIILSCFVPVVISLKTRFIK